MFTKPADSEHLVTESLGQKTISHETQKKRNAGKQNFELRQLQAGMPWGD